jgi:Reverse transcriptase (RNA-dependent DNA polymerase)
MWQTSSRDQRMTLSFRPKCYDENQKLEQGRTVLTPQNSITYLLEDYPRTLFPLSTTKVIAEQWGDKVLEYIYQKVLKGGETDHSFLAQTRCYSSKQGFHLRRTMKLDPVAELFIYDLIYRNKVHLRKDFSDSRRSFGYRFEEGEPVSPTKGYAAFKAAITEARDKYKHSVKFDVAAYFNSIYHHDLVKWFSDIGANADDVEYCGQFLREVNGGRSVDCLPHGIHPCKLIGSEFLKFVDNSMQLNCQLSLRFMDDFYFFSDSEDTINGDFVAVQKLLGDKGLSLNSTKTSYGNEAQTDIAQQVDAMKVGLLKARRFFIEVSGLEIKLEDEDEPEEMLTDEQTEYLLTLLRDTDIEESDAELVLVLLRDHGEDVLARLEMFLRRFPSLSRNVYHFAKFVTDKEELSTLIHDFVSDEAYATEDQLFWMAKLSEELLGGTSNYRDIISAIYYHPNATVISRAKVLEIPEQRFGMPEMREEHLRAGKSDWLAWASAVGCRAAPPISRNHSLMYFAKASPMNRLISECVRAT